MEQMLLADLVNELPNAVRLQRAVHVMREQFECDAVGLLALEADGAALCCSPTPPVCDHTVPPRTHLV
jgi:anaerobic nitric oxide reductase transcription regulator